MSYSVKKKKSRKRQVCTVQVQIINAEITLHGFAATISFQAQNVSYGLMNTLCKICQQGAIQLQLDQGNPLSLEQFQNHRLKMIATNKMRLSVRVLGYKCVTTHKQR